MILLDGISIQHLLLRTKKLKKEKDIGVTMCQQPSKGDKKGQN